MNFYFFKAVDSREGNSGEGKLKRLSLAKPKLTSLESVTSHPQDSPEKVRHVHSPITCIKGDYS